MSARVPTTEMVANLYEIGDGDEANYRRRAERRQAFFAWLAAHDAEVRASVHDDPAKDERLVRYMAMATPLGYQSALAVAQQMTALIDAETRARAAGVVAEEPEWEYRTLLHGIDPQPHGRLNRGEITPGEWHAALHEDDQNITLERRRKAGPWVPVEQEGAGT